MCFKIFEKIQPISRYWFAAQQQTSTCRRQKFALFYPEFTPEFNELSLMFWTRQEVAKKWVKLKQSRKPYICDIRRLRINSLVNNSRVVSKEGPFVIFLFFLTF